MKGHSDPMSYLRSNGQFLLFTTKLGHKDCLLKHDELSLTQTYKNSVTNDG